MATETRYGWELPDLGDVADAPDAFLQFANDISDTVAAAASVAYTPSWTSDGAIQPVNPATRTGIYQLETNKICHFYIQLTFGASTGGGTGALRLGLPFPGRTGMIQINGNSRLYVPNYGQLAGQMEIRAGESNALVLMPLSRGDSYLAYWQSADSSATPATGYPNPGDSIHNVRNGGSIVVCGSYLTA